MFLAEFLDEGSSVMQMSPALTLFVVMMMKVTVIKLMIMLMVDNKDDQ